MSRSGYSDDYDGDDWSLIKYRGWVASALRGKRGQKFLRDLIAALDAMPAKRLIAHELEVAAAENPLIPWLFANCQRPGSYWDRDDVLGFLYQREDEALLKWFGAEPHCGVCALGALGNARGLGVARLDPEDAEAVAATFDIAEPLAREVVWENDENGGFTPERRWQHMRDWAASHMRAAVSA